jgi:hypothetical protein
MRSLQVDPEGAQPVSPPPRKQRPRVVGALGLVAFGSAVGGAVVWDTVNPHSNPIELALKNADTADPQSIEADQISARLLKFVRPGVQALRDLRSRGNEVANRGRSAILHWLDQDRPSEITVEQIRARLAGMQETDFLTWLRSELR